MDLCTLQFSFWFSAASKRVRAVRVPSPRPGLHMLKLLLWFCIVYSEMPLHLRFWIMRFGLSVNLKRRVQGGKYTWEREMFSLCFSCLLMPRAYGVSNWLIYASVVSSATWQLNVAFCLVDMIKILINQRRWVMFLSVPAIDGGTFTVVCFNAVVSRMNTRVLFWLVKT